ncbi:MAG TPA: PQQ-binding-like beta-propeller repeat protein [Acidobacteriota bacterium]|nr:PQQ-binding-like beta-propeller repeat protein [Acidobacteriota bacterium]
MKREAGELKLEDALNWFLHKIIGIPQIIFALACFSALVLIAQDALPQFPATFPLESGVQDSGSGSTRFAAPARLERTIQLEGVLHPRMLLASSTRALLFERDSESMGLYRMVDLIEGEIEWTFQVDSDPGFSPTASWEGDLLLVTGSQEVICLDAASGEQRWRHSGIGATDGRQPVVSAAGAVYATSDLIRKVDADDGSTFWERSEGTDAAPLLLVANSVLFVDSDGQLNRLRSDDGSLIWTAGESTGGDGSQLRIDRGAVFITDLTTGRLTAHRLADGSEIWQQAFPAFGAEAHIQLASGRLFVATADFKEELGSVYALRPETGDELWKTDDPPIQPIIVPLPFAGPAWLTVAEGQVFYFSLDSSSFFALDSRTGAQRWMIPALFPFTIAGVSQSRSRMTILFSERREGSSTAAELRVYRPSGALFFPHLAIGLGQTSRVYLSNPNLSDVSGRAFAFDPGGGPLGVTLEGERAPEFDFVLGSASTTVLEFSGTDILQSGWLLVESDLPLAGSLVFRLEQDGTVAEAGVASATLTSQASIAVSREAEVSTALAIVTPYLEEQRLPLTGAGIVLRLLNGDGTLVSEARRSLPTGSQLAAFIEELFTLPSGDDFRGTLIVESTRPIGITVLRTGRGVQLSSLPVGQQ